MGLEKSLPTPEGPDTACLRKKDFKTISIMLFGTYILED